MHKTLAELWKACGVSLPGVDPVIKPGQILIYALPLDCSSIKAVRPFLSIDEKNRAALYNCELDELHYAVSRTLLRGVLGLHIDCDPGELVFRYGSRGRPELEQEQSAGFGFSLARRDDHLVVAIGHRRRIGIDLEAVRSASMVEPILRMLAPKELAGLDLELSCRQEPNRNRRLIHAWTALEARAKAAGTGLEIGCDIANNGDVECQSFDIGRDLIGCVAAEGLNWRLKLIRQEGLLPRTT